MSIVVANCLIIIIQTLKHFVPDRVHPTSHVPAVAVQAVGLAAAQVRGAHLKKAKKPQETVQVAVPKGKIKKSRKFESRNATFQEPSFFLNLHDVPLQGAVQCLVERGQHRNLSFWLEYFFRL